MHSDLEGASIRLVKKDLFRNPWFILGRLNNIRARLTLLYLILFGSTLIIFSLVLHDVFLESHLKEFDAALYNYAVDVLESIDISHAGDLSVSPTVDFDRGKTFPFPLGTGLMLIRTMNGNIITRYGPEDNFTPPFREDFRLLAHGHDAVFRTLSRDFVKKFLDGDHEYRLISFPIDDSPTPQIILQIAVPMTSLERQTKGLGRFFLITVPVILFLATVLGYFMARRALEPVSGIIKKASSINPQVLSDRIPLPKINDEIYQLTQTLNHMLDRIEQAFRSQERFIADASHQLLTPLATMRVELDVLRQRDGDDVKIHIASFSQEIDRLSRIVKDMLLLAQADAGVANLQKQKSSITEIIFSMISKVEKAYRDKNVRIRLNLVNHEANEEPLISVDPDLIELMLYNLLENAVKYSSAESIVKVDVQNQKTQILISITDQGPGIPLADQEHIFDRFYRSSHTAHSATGFGLGLAICKKVAQLHGASLDLDSEYREGARFLIRFPVIG